MNRYWKKLTVVCALAAISIVALQAQKANVVYVEGISHIKSTSGNMRKADIGSTLAFGESVITGKDGFVELKLANGSDIRIMQNSVFGYSNIGTGTESRQILATTAGKIAYKLNKATGRSPLIQTNSMVAGVRGTEFTVMAARDGSVLLEVTGGIVDVMSQGKTVTLNKDEGVEVVPGKAPGEKYVRLGKELDFSAWNKGKMDDFYADPVGGLERVEALLENYKKELDSMKKPYKETTDVWNKITDDYKKLLASGDQDAIKKFQQETLYPAQDTRLTLILNIRYHALNYLSVRRFVMTNMYMEMKSRYPIEKPSAVQAFFAKYDEMLGRYEEVIVPELNETDY